MPAPPAKRTLRSRLRRLTRTLLPQTWVLRADLRRIDRWYQPRIAQAKGDEERMLAEEHMEARADVEEQLEGLQTQRLLGRARRYYIVAPKIPWEKDPGDGDDNWSRGWASGTWSLTPSAAAAIQRQIEEAKGRRREAWATWVKLLGGLITGLVALVSALVSFVLALRR